MTHNLPISRRGITATSAKVDYCNRREFLVDMAVYAGPSGSPVYAYNPIHEQECLAQDGSSKMRRRLLLVGILYGYYPLEATDDPRILKIPTNYVPIPVTTIPINLGAVIKSTRIKEFEPSLREQIDKAGA